ncbi:hypothetical protein ACLK1S_13880 [Escherichia coli]
MATSGEKKAKGWRFYGLQVFGVKHRFPLASGRRKMLVVGQKNVAAAGGAQQSANRSQRSWISLYSDSRSQLPKISSPFRFSTMF